ncbi:MAG: hypothetical protein CL920_24785 [Deltaproteobacteria bacterium]|nr:hypothetical protein [Deltaproteobacteria bacterium]|tara:strand:+ start:2842 stop:3516 length:675 start_codon:yes stop_codon:yes gene_type:complete
MTGNPLREVCPGLYVAEAKQRFYGLEVGARMTIIQHHGTLFVHSPIAISPADVAHLGTPGQVLAPNLLHHLYVGPWIDAGYEGWAAPGLPEKRKDVHFHGVITPGVQPFGEDIEVLPMACFAMTNEVVVLHKPSRTLLVTDLVFNLSPKAPWMTRTAMRCLGGYPGCNVTLLEQVGMKRDVARRELGIIAEWDFDRVIMAHGEIIETGGKETFFQAFQWVLIGT